MNPFSIITTLSGSSLDKKKPAFPRAVKNREVLPPPLPLPKAAASSHKKGRVKHLAKIILCAAYLIYQNTYLLADRTAAGDNRHH
jgi:hypothetical protein